MGSCRKYTRDDVSYDTWYSSWMKQLALNYTRDQLEAKLYGTKKESRKAAASHLRAIDATRSMTGSSARRAHTKNVVAACGDTAIALAGAIEIYDLFPEHTKSAKAV